MSDTNMTTGLVQTWVPTTDDGGRTRLEAHWISAPAVPAHATHAA
ncbi:MULTISPECIES: hypothetical protein [Nocardioides]|nr:MULTISPECIES: hypothetical protein [unclassified Nocardioides]